MRGARLSGHRRILRSFRALNGFFFLALVGFVAGKFGVQPEQDKSGTLKLSIMEHDKLTPARVELLDRTGKAHIADDALPIEYKGKHEHKVANTFTGTDQFYSRGTSQASLPPGDYTVSVSKGTEYRIKNMK
jgi:hypothetical protein